MRARRPRGSWLAPIGLLAALAGCSEVTLGDGSTPPSSSSSSSSSPPTYTLEDVFWCSGDTACLETRQQTQLLEEQHRQDRALMVEQHQEQVRATNRAAGLDPDAGNGWWCYSGTLGERTLGECRRTMDACTNLLASRERAGLVPTKRQCDRQPQAACFRVTRDLKEGERRMCFDSMDACHDTRGQVDPAGFASPPTECEATS